VLLKSAKLVFIKNISHKLLGISSTKQRLIKLVILISA
jgi:hypothetical protein